MQGVAKKIGGAVLSPLMNRRDNHTTSVYPGVPSNLLAWPNFGNTFGATITAPSPWVHTGAAAFNRLDMLNTVATTSARRIRLEASSGVKQVLAITPTAGTPLYYQANVWVYFMATSSDRVRIALENDTTGEVYDEVFLAAQAANASSGIITLEALPNVTATGQSYRLVIQNLGTVNVNQLQMNWQLVSANSNAAV